MKQYIFLLAFFAFIIAESSGLVCWECEDAYGQEECLRRGEAVRCAANQDFCHLELRHGGWGKEPWIEKTCKTRKSCEDNYVQNARAAWAKTGKQIQCNENFPSSVCRCCCSGDLCNQHRTSCLIVSECPAMVRPRRGYMSCDNKFNLLSECEFSCRINSALEGARVLNCDAFGNWSGPEPTCERITCAPGLKTPRYGSQVCTKGLRLRSKCSFSCQEGYRLHGQDVVECIDDRDGDKYGVWSGMKPECKPLQCREQRALRHGILTCTDENLVGSSCTFQCNAEEGYLLYPPVQTPQVSLTCQNDQLWNQDRPCCTLPCPPFAVMDFVIVLDSSSSVGAANWVLMKDFVLSFISEFTIREDSTNVAVIRYNDDVDRKNQILLNDYPTDRESLLRAIKDIPYDGEGTRTGRAIDYTINTILRSGNGNRPLARDIVLLITDGVSQDRVALPSRRLRNTGALVYVLPIRDEGGEVNLRQIRDIAGHDNEHNILTAALERGFEALDETFARNITSLLCNQPCFNSLHGHEDDAREQ